MNRQDTVPEPPDSIVTSPATDDDGLAEPTGDAPLKVTLLEGMKVLFDEKVGLAPAQVVDKSHDRRANGRSAPKGYRNGH